jgi:hypothetical protein
MHCIDRNSLLRFIVDIHTCKIIFQVLLFLCDYYIDYYIDPQKRKQLLTKRYTAPRNWRVLVNTVMNLRVPYKAVHFLTN